ncbi:MAG: hypothetical protein ACQETE_16190 [Bacteroidota bacterium]
MNFTVPFRHITLFGILFLVLSACNLLQDNESKSLPEKYRDLPGTLITEDTTWSGNLTLEGKYYVLPGVTLTIEKGTTVSFAYHEGDVQQVGALITLRTDRTNFSTVRPSGRLIAEGTAEEPIIFTSARVEPKPGDWGGIIMVGEAVNNLPGGQGEVEGLPEFIAYGGDQPLDDSGSLKYVRIEYVGYGFKPNSEINGLSLYSVGRNTTVSHVQVYKSTDDGFEIFGGSVNASYLISAFNEDDSFDIDQGWKGYGQYWLAVQAPGADKGIEADGRAVPGEGKQYQPIISNVTLVGPGNDNGLSNGTNYGMHLRDDFTGTLLNFVITRFDDYTFKLEAQTTTGTTDLTYQNFNPSNPQGNVLQIDQITSYENGGFANNTNRYKRAVKEENPKFKHPEVWNFSLQADSPALSGAFVPRDEFLFFEQVPFIGALGTENWATGNWVRWSDD